MSMLILSGYGRQEKKTDDDLCLLRPDVLCVKDVLLYIVNAG